MPHKLAPLICLLMAAIPAAILADGPVVTATHVWLHPTSPDSEVLFGYMTLKNHSGQAITLVNISSPDFASVTISRVAHHKSEVDSSAAKHLSLAAHGSLSFSPDQDYLVLSKPGKKLYEGDLVTLMLFFSDHSSLSILAPVRQEPPGS